ncbi:MAG: 50S ribosomal protein L9 [Candidatus [Bacteroides] periocalifornicus]|uniref:Large ribosomal subunit protein bL9 n=1 Tax=Candidatus [Bacteroides] periocalifornicus TaxID=1702214 RepID=A0A0Q4B7R1_9BACT|nr:MAG: 50S ribosomal protein L9 [Candidatus [Bacteroides] periocalifornicus]
MEIILKEFVNGLGEVDDLVNVKAGFARNYLIPTGKAIAATPSAKKQLAETLRQREHKAAKIREEAQALAAKLEGVKLTIGAKTSSTGKIFGSVNTIQLAEALEAKGFNVDRKRITIDQDPVKEVGSYKATIRLHKEVSVVIDFDVVSE